MDKRTHNLKFVTNDGIEFPVSFDIYQGASDYQVWLQQPGNSGKTEAQYQEWLRGLSGDYPVQCIVTEELIPIPDE